MNVWLALTPLAPLALALLATWHPVRPWCVRLAPLAFLPALVTALLPSSGGAIEWLLLGTHFSLDSVGRAFLLPSAVLWTLGALFARAWLARDPARGRFFGFFLAAAAGNLGVCVAQDIASFYLLFALMTFSAWGLVLHRHTPAAHRAGGVYVTLAVLGEAALLAAFVLIAASGDLSLAGAPAAAAISPARDLIVALLLTGFGVKTGVLGLHVALPLAYAATPAPGAAVLAAAMIKAGLLGWLRFLPLGHSLPEWSAVFIALGIAAAFYGVVVGLAQREPKTILAYSSVSQMGLITVGVGCAFAGPAAYAPALLAVTVYALHHAFAKGALFFGEALARVTRRRARRWVLAGLALPAAALAGAPFTSGALAKQALKDAVVFAPWAGLLSLSLTLAAIGTTLLMLRFLWCVWRAPVTVTRRPLAALASPWLVALVFVLVGVGAALRLPFDVSASALLAAAWPVALGVAIGALVLRYLRASFALPPGDVLVPIERVLAAASALRGPGVAWPRLRAPSFGGAVGEIERALRSWSVVGALLFLLLGAFTLLLVFAP
jgi:formate hydrogenlyase subunit 3/multisubunit Na+/H+ antiporter MnhD subunit